MTRSRPSLLASLALLASLSLLAGCGGDDEDGGDGGGGGGGEDSSQVGAEGGDTTIEGDSCDSTVTITGAQQAEWSNDGVVQVVGASEVSPPVTYESVDGDFTLQVSGSGNGFDDPLVILLVGDDTSYGVVPGEGTVDVDPEGGGATVEAEAASSGGDDPVTISAEWSC